MYDILIVELLLQSSENILQMAIKAVDDTARLNGLVPTLLVSGALPRTTIDSETSFSVIQRAQVIKKAIIELRKIAARRNIRDALNAHNGPYKSQFLPQIFPLESEVCVFKKRVTGKGPTRLQSARMWM